MIPQIITAYYSIESEGIMEVKCPYRYISLSPVHNHNTILHTNLKQQHQHLIS